MYRVEMMERLLVEAVQRGFVVRQEWLGGRGGGGCEIAGRKYLFIDLAISTADQLAQVNEALARDAEESHSIAFPKNGGQSKAA